MAEQADSTRLPAAVESDGPFIITTPRIVHRKWWTVVSPIPSTRQSWSYHALRRVWFDHTNNWSVLDVPKFFVEGLEDQLTPTLFQPWLALPGTDWAAGLLRLLGCEVVGAVRRIAWSYQYEERLPTGKWSAIADIVIHWQDDAGRAVAVVEAKRPKGTVSEKDLYGECYLSIPSFADAGRRVHYALLIDGRDRDRLKKRYADLAHAVTWQDLLACQIEAIDAARLDAASAQQLTSAVLVRAAHLGFQPSCGTRPQIDALARARGTPARYRELAERATDPPVREALIGFDVVLTAQRGDDPTPPYAWLNEEPEAAAIQRAKQQNEHDWSRRVWHLDWDPSSTIPALPHD